jgi:hypothetical protein
MTNSPIVRVAWVAAVGFFVVIGAWPFFAPRSFYDVLATFPPFNMHLMRDIGAMTLGVGGALLAAMRFKDGLLVALAGASTAGVFHVASHIIDADLGGKPTDVPLLSALAVLLIAGAVVRAREVRG